MTDQPCAQTDSNPDDWFIGKDGRQYPDDEFITFEERTRVARSVLYKQGETADEHSRRIARAINAIIGDRKRRALRARRHAKEACHACPVRLQCLSAVLELGVLHGTWGGLYEEEIAEVRSHRDPGRSA